jgi:hypothetical protein
MMLKPSKAEAASSSGESGADDLSELLAWDRFFFFLSGRLALLDPVLAIAELAARLGMKRSPL